MDQKYLIMKINNKNTLTLITVSYNSEKTIKETLESVRNQISKPDQYIVVDGGSNDSTIEIVNEYRDVVTDIISEEDSGIYDAMNKGIKFAKCDILGLLNSDDTYIDQYVIDRVKNGFKQDIDIFCGGVNYVDFDGNIKMEWILRDNVDNIEGGWHPPHPAFFAKKKV